MGNFWGPVHKIEAANGGMICGLFFAHPGKGRQRPAKGVCGPLKPMKSNSNDSPCQRPWPGDAIEDGDRRGRQ